MTSHQGKTIMVIIFRPFGSTNDTTTNSVKVREKTQLKQAWSWKPSALYSH